MLNHLEGAFREPNGGLSNAEAHDYPVAILVSSPALACYDEARRPVARYSYGYTAPMSYARYAYADDDDYYGGYYGNGGLGLAVGAGIARRAYWRNRWDNRGRGYVAHRAAFRGSSIGRVGGIGRAGGGRIGGRR
jgi:hypothetical protein